MDNLEITQRTNPAGKKTDLSFIIINYNLAKEIDDCLSSLLDKISTNEKLSYEIIVVDNNSTDKNLKDVENKYAEAKINFYYLEENLGFGKGCNFGFSKATGEYICFLNPDTIIKEDIFSPIIKIFENDNSIGIIGPKQQTRPPFFDFSAGFYPNILFELVNLVGMGVFFEGMIMSALSKIKKNSIIQVDWILGAAIFIKADIFKMIDGFDRDYFMFFEEVDLCKRVKSIGYKIIYIPSLCIHHIGSVSGKKDYRLYTIRTYSSKYIYISKHYISFYKILMKTLLFAQLFSQLVIWTVMFPLKAQKSRQKLNAFAFLLRHKLKNE